jgi:hypothetical protein
MLLWHGSRLSNWVGILSKGLRIAPPEAPSTGYRLGKVCVCVCVCVCVFHLSRSPQQGVYLANTVSKSASYCFTDAANNVGVMMLAEAALGKQWITQKDHFMTEAQPGTHSTYAQGQYSPDPSANVMIESAHEDVGGGSVCVPCGVCKATAYSRSSFTHDELVVYDTKQVKMRYVFIIDMDHNVGRKKRK